MTSVFFCVLGSFFGVLAARLIVPDITPEACLIGFLFGSVGSFVILEEFRQESGR